jgi:hypothetical protein
MKKYKKRRSSTKPIFKIPLTRKERNYLWNLECFVEELKRHFSAHAWKPGNRR